MGIAYKTPGEIKPVLYDFEDELAGATIETVEAVLAVGPAGAAELVAETQANSETTVAVVWKGGEDQADYATSVRVVSSDGTVLETGGEISVRAYQGIVPEIPGTYLSAAEYVDRFGRLETVQLTDESNQGLIDADKLGRALQDSTQEVDSYLAGRYVLPLVPVPGVIAGIVADITRLRLHRNLPPDEVRDAAARARTMLKDMADGRAKLPGQDGTVAPAASSGSPSYSSAPRVNTADTAARFSTGLPLA
jgi:phage gp36-like protein